MIYAKNDDSIHGEPAYTASAAINANFLESTRCTNRRERLRSYYNYFQIYGLATSATSDSYMRKLEVQNMECRMIGKCRVVGNRASAACCSDAGQVAG